MLPYFKHPGHVKFCRLTTYKQIVSPYFRESDTPGVTVLQKGAISIESVDDALGSDSWFAEFHAMDRSAGNAYRNMGPSALKVLESQKILRMMRLSCLRNITKSGSLTLSGPDILKLLPVFLQPLGIRSYHVMPLIRLQICFLICIKVNSS